MRRRALLGGSAALALSCKRAGEEPLVVFAAASLREVMTQLAATWSRDAHVPVRPTFDATPRLAQQVLAGAVCDAFASADEAWMDELEKHGEVAPGTRRDVATTDLVLIVPRDAASHIAAPDDLARVRRLAIAGEHVPAGRYARAALQSVGVWGSIEPKVVSGESVRVALEWVARGEADAGVVYASDPHAEPRVRVAFTFAKGSHPEIRYPAAVLRRARRPSDAAAFLDAFRIPAGRAALATAGFRALP